MKDFQKLHKHVKELLARNGYQYGDDASENATVGYILARKEGVVLEARYIVSLALQIAELKAQLEKLSVATTQA